MKKHYKLLLSITIMTLSWMVQASDYPQFTRYTTEQLIDIANPNKLKHRIFYENPSQGEHAAWFDAVKQGNITLIKKMVAQGQDIEVKDEASFGQTALLWAAFIGYLDIVEYLVDERGANLFASDRADVQNVLKSAILGGNIDVINYLYPKLKNKISIDNQDERDGETALMVAVDNNRIEAVKFLLDKGAAVNIVSQQLNLDAFNYACRKNNVVMIELLTSAGAVNHKTGKPDC